MEIAALALDTHQFGVHEFLQVEGQRRRRDVEHRGQDAGRHARGAGADEGAEHAQTGLLGQGGKGSDGRFFIHSSKYMEMMAWVKYCKAIPARKFANASDDVYNANHAHSGVEEQKLTLPIVLFLALGACFGLVTYSNRHLFSEGPTRRGEQGRSDPMNGRIMWVLICTFLWPIMALTGLHSWWVLARRRALAVRSKRD